MRFRLLEALCAALTRSPLISVESVDVGDSRAVSIACFFVMALAGCATTSTVTPPAPDIVPADPGVPTPCVAAIPARPELYAEKEWARTPADPDMRVRTLKADRRTLLQHVAKLEATLTACKTP